MSGRTEGSSGVRGTAQQPPALRRVLEGAPQAEGRSPHAIHGAMGGRPRVEVQGEDVLRLRAAGLSWRKAARTLGIGPETARRLAKGIGRGVAPANAPRPSQKPRKGVL